LAAGIVTPFSAMTARNSVQQWSINDEEKLIEYYEQHPMLWDPKNPAYSTSGKSDHFDVLVHMFDTKYSGKYCNDFA
jgi:hypothetical protein